MMLAFVIAFDPAVRDPSILNWQGAIGQEILIAIGTSILSSTVFYWIYSRTAEERVLKEISANASEAATEYTLGLFQERFERMLPTKVYPATDVPVAEFDHDFDMFLKDSKIYKFKGDTANFTTFRLTTLCEQGYPVDKDITLLLIDPVRDDLIEGRAKGELSGTRRAYSKLQLTEVMHETRLSIFVAMISLFDICHAIKVELAFHQEHSFFRTELLDGALFLTYYLGGPFQGTYLYSQATFPYIAYLQNFRQNYATSKYRITFDSPMTENDLSKHLTELGCKLSIEELRQRKEERFAKYRQMIRY